MTKRRDDASGMSGSHIAAVNTAENVDANTVARMARAIPSNAHGVGARGNTGANPNAHARTCGLVRTGTWRRRGPLTSSPIRDTAAAAMAAPMTAMRARFVATTIGARMA